MKNYNVTEYWNERGNPCSNVIDDLTFTHKSYLQAQTSDCKNILDFGPGYGRMFSAYTSVAEVVAIDVTDQHLETLQTEAKKQGFDFKFIHKKDNFDKLDFPDKYFDAVVTSEVLFHQTPDTVVNIMKELSRISLKVIVISYMNLKEPYDKIGEHIPDKRYCFNYNYYRICEKNNWYVINEDRIKNQIMFVYSDIFIFDYKGQDIKFLFDGDDYYMSRIIKNTKSFYELKYLEYLKNEGIINKQSEVVEIGAYLGNHSIYFSKIIGCNWIHCFEPTLDSYRVLNYNLEMNNITNRTCYHIAIASKNSKLKMYKSNPDNPGANQYKYDENGEKCITLDSIGLSKIDFIKIDVENMEVDVLKGCQNSIDKFKPVIMIEVGENNIGKIKNWMVTNKYERISKVFNKNTWLLESI